MSSLIALVYNNHNHNQSAICEASQVLATRCLSFCFDERYRWRC